MWRIVHFFMSSAIFLCGYLAGIVEGWNKAIWVVAAVLCWTLIVAPLVFEEDTD